MQNSLYRKSLVLIIMLLFIGVNVISALSNFHENIDHAKKTNDKSFLQIPPLRNTRGGDTLYVGGIGPDNYTKIQYAIDNATNGDTIFVYNGSYPEFITINKSINLVGESKIHTDIDGVGVVGTLVTIEENYVNISDITIQGSGGNGVEISDSSNNTFTNCDIRNHAGYCVYMTNTSYTSLIDCHIHDSDSYGIFIESPFQLPLSSSNILIENSNISLNGGGGFWAWDKNGNYDIYAVTIVNCTFYSNDAEGIRFQDSKNNIIKNCTIHSNDEYGIDLDTCKYNEVEDCDIF